MIDIYQQKITELWEMLKIPIMTEDEIRTKISAINTFVHFHQLHDYPQLDLTHLIVIAREIQTVYRILWDSKYIKDWKPTYRKLSLSTRKMYDEYEVKLDWRQRKRSKKRYDSFIHQIESVHYDHLDAFKKRFDLYMKQQHFFSEKPEHFLNWEITYQKYQHKLLYSEMKHVGSVSFKMVHCPTGSFWMGSHAHEGNSDERPRHLVKITKPFWMAETVVTQELWLALMGWHFSFFKDDIQFPVESVSWLTCLVFCNELSKLHGFKPCYTLSNIEIDFQQKTFKKADVEWHRDADGYRLPTEAEWEYSAKAGTEFIYSGSNHPDEVAVTAQNDHEVNNCVVKSKKPNDWGLYDMSGCIWEYCMDQWYENAYQSRYDGIEDPVAWPMRDWPDDTYHSTRFYGPLCVVKGGWTQDRVDYARVAQRCDDMINDGAECVGLRLVRNA
jgi:formylglycine-generating enzyme required for sulfatase activity